MKLISRVLWCQSFLIVIALSACAGSQEKETKDIPVFNRALNMVVPHDSSVAYELYGIKLGEKKSSVENKYRLVSCQQGLDSSRCTVLLNTINVAGVISKKKIIIFITFKKNVVESMTVSIFPSDITFVEKMLQDLYGAPVSASNNVTSWSNASGEVYLDLNSGNNNSAVLKYKIK